MTVAVAIKEITDQLGKQFPGSVIESSEDSVLVQAERLPDIAGYLKNTPGLQFDYLVSVTAVDYRKYFEVVYQLVSTVHNHRLTVKVRSSDRANPVVPSVVSLWRGADLQEREIYDLFGIRFEGHPDLKRIVLWDGFPGYPLRKE